VLSHRNIVVGALSVAEYLENSPEDRILSLLPLSFDAGLSQVTTALASGARVILLDYLLPRDVVRVCEQHQVTGMTGVPPLWMQLVDQEWPEAATRGIRYFANTGGKMPQETLQRLRRHFPKAKPFLMYGLTEAFRSTYLPPHEVDRIPDSIGKAIPNVEVLVVKSDGSPCEPGEHGELVHRGPLVSLGYWKDPERTRERFRPAPGQPKELPNPEIAVWSGDTVTQDAQGFLYFVGRTDDMIKSSGYRISPTELEEVAFASGLVLEAAAIGVPDSRLGQRVIIVARPRDSNERTADLLDFYRAQLPAFMVPSQIEWRGTLPRNPNGKIDRRQLAIELSGACEEGPR
jgi:acyl-CoA ligase (AMP-forming) (exosortase A-associated)